MGRWVMVLAVMGCNQLYGLDATKQRDAATLADEDGDGVFDLEDNCPARANPEQYDADGDLRGDVCDDCPLLANPQGDDKDGDGLGDGCDPHPDARGDCLLVVDGFGDPAAFASHWKVTTDAQASAVAEPGRVVLKPSGPTSSVLITETSTAGTLADVMVLGRVMFRVTGDVSVTAVSSARDDSAYYGCRLEPPLIAAGGPNPSTEEIATLVPSDMVGDRFLLRLNTAITSLAMNPIEVSCRIDYGVSVATKELGDRALVSGPAGVRASKREVTIDAISITAFQPNQTCTTVYR